MHKEVMDSMKMFTTMQVMKKNVIEENNDFSSVNVTPSKVNIDWLFTLISTSPEPIIDLDQPP